MALRSLSTAALRAELARREKGAAKLQKQHSKVAKALAKLEGELAGLGGIIIVSGKRRGRPPGSKNKRRGRKASRPAGRRARASNKLTLADALAKAVRVGSTVSPADAAAAVKRIYKSTSRTFGIQVASTLAKSPLFKKTGRGQYLRKGGATTAPAKRGPKPKMGRKARKSSGRRRKAGRPKGSKNKKAAPTPAAAAS